MAPDKFRIGQRVIWITPRPDSREYRATVVSQRERRPHVDTGRQQFVYRLNVDGHGTHHESGTLYAAPESALRPLYDGDQVVSWSACAWRPTEVTAEQLNEQMRHAGRAMYEVLERISREAP